MYRVSVERDSVSPAGRRLTTFVIEFPRIVLAETVTHRLNSDCWAEASLCERTTTPDVSKNSASSRAIPHERFVGKIKTDPYIPEWTGAAKGMQGGVATRDQKFDADQAWLAARDSMLIFAEILNRVGVHKQDSNRLLEPWAWVTQVVTSSAWDNFFALRCHEMAHPAFRKVARMMYLARRDSAPDRLDYGQWHLPFVPREQALGLSWLPVRMSVPAWGELPVELRRSAARCAWVSYENHLKEATDEACDATCERLVGSRPVHASPFEHQNTPAGPGLAAVSRLRSNIAGWVQARKLLPAERCDEYHPSEDEVRSWPEFNGAPAVGVAP